MDNGNLQTETKSGKELMFSAILYEVIATILTSILLISFTDYDLFDAFELSIIISTMALLWNMIFNYFFDLYLIKKRGHIVKSKTDRILHGAGFEVGLAVFALLFIKYYKQVTLYEAFLLEAFFLAFFLVYTVVYTYIYDVIRAFVIKKRRKKNST